MKATVKKTTKADQKIAIDSLKGFQVLSKKLHSSTEKSVKIKFEDSDKVISIPKKALTLLSDIIENMANGKSVSIVPSNSELSTQRAADILGVSRPHLVKLLETQKIPFQKVGSHRRVALQDLLNYKQKANKLRNKQLYFLANQAQELNLGYE